MTRRSRWPAIATGALATAILVLYLLVRSTRSALIVVTPTHDTLNRYAHVMSLAHGLATSSAKRSLVWVVVEDAADVDPAIDDLLATSGIKYHYLASQSTGDSAHRGLKQRNAALDWIAAEGVEGTVYFADDDNAYRPGLWRRLQGVPKDAFTILPVGNMGYFGWEGPIFGDVKNGKAPIEQWSCDFCVRRWNVDMSGFAFSTTLLADRPSLRFDEASEQGFLETDFLSRIESSGAASLVVLPGLINAVHVWHNYGVPFHGAAFYDATWTTGGTIGRRMDNESDVVLGFTWAEADLPLAAGLSP
ncbi:hypothetical protein JCM10908_006988 [Rhodotorula pacifica]|uniref:uncharacterized protein n=1 Tax=Rhodotorula pacifica TaxID=1495444 RepID=UPI003173FF1B